MTTCLLAVPGPCREQSLKLHCEAPTPAGCGLFVGCGDYVADYDPHVVSSAPFDPIVFATFDDDRCDLAAMASRPGARPSPPAGRGDKRHDPADNIDLPGLKLGPGGPLHQRRVARS